MLNGGGLQCLWLVQVALPSLCQAFPPRILLLLWSRVNGCLKAWSGRLEFKLGLLGPHVLHLSAIPQDDAETVVRLAQDLEPLKGAKEESLDEALLRTIALSSAGSLSPMAAILGGVAAQEVLKVGTGRKGRDWESGQVSVCTRGHPY